MERVSEWQQQSKDDEKSILKLYYFYAKYISFESIFVWLDVCALEGVYGWVGGRLDECMFVYLCLFLYWVLCEYGIHVCYATWACERLRFYTSVFIWMLLPVSLSSRPHPPFPRCNNTILFSKHPHRNTQRKSGWKAHTSCSKLLSRSRSVRSLFHRFQAIPL